MGHRLVVVVGLVTLAALGLPRVGATQPAPAPLLQEGPTNTAVGQGALLSITTGELNTAVGVNALLSTTSGLYNTAVGATALSSNTTGVDNTAIGTFSLSNNATGFENTATGLNSLSSNTSGFQNTATGARVLEGNTIGYGNTATGYYAMISNSSGTNNTANGTAALAGNTTGSGNTAIGLQALQSTTSGIGNTAVGHVAGINATGSFNVFLGANVDGTAADTNTMRLGLPYDSGTGAGQNRTFIAGIHGTQVPGSYLQVVVNANGQMGTLTPPVQLSGGATATAVSVLQQQVQEQQAINADLRTRLARLEALVTAGARRK